MRYSGVAVPLIFVAGLAYSGQTAPDQAKVEAALKAHGFGTWKSIVFDKRTWEVEDAIDASGKQFDLRINASTLKIYAGYSGVRRETGKEEMVEVHHDEGVANRIDLEFLRRCPRGPRRSLTGERIGERNRVEHQFGTFRACPSCRRQDELFIRSAPRSTSLPRLSAPTTTILLPKSGRLRAKHTSPAMQNGSKEQIAT